VLNIHILFLKCFDVGKSFFNYKISGEAWSARDKMCSSMLKIFISVTSNIYDNLFQEIFMPHMSHLCIIVKWVVFTFKTNMSHFLLSLCNS